MVRIVREPLRLIALVNPIAQTKCRPTEWNGCDEDIKVAPTGVRPVECQAINATANAEEVNAATGDREFVLVGHAVIPQPARTNRRYPPAPRTFPAPSSFHSTLLHRIG